MSMSNSAPEKIYLDPALDALTKALSEKTEDDVEYIRTDAFIEKAISWLKEQDEMIGISFKEDFIERFKKYMEG